ncbi:MAG: tripartite tricarboxylate transporter substrate binding protein [Pigmentiphaga sp.]|nr:tripartite tricarboxylate transporter substrate binding protein [Pigmentiphaga sp.]
MLRNIFIAALCTLSSGTSIAAEATERWPSQPITFVVPWAAGGSTDALARIVAEDVSGTLGVPVIVENRGGASGTIGASYVARAKPDGYTFMVDVSGGLINAEFLYGPLTYSPANDFAPVTLLAGEPIMIAANPKLPVANVKEMVERSKESELTFAVAGIGTTGHLSGELLAQHTGANLRVIPYKGSGPAVTDAIAGHTDLVIVSPMSVIPHAQTNRLKALAVTSAQRMPAAPDVPTLLESGYDVEIHTWYMVAAPAKTPASIITRMNEAIATALQKPDVISRIEALGSIPQASTPEELGELLTAERQKWGETIRKANITVN